MTLVYPPATVDEALLELALSGSTERASLNLKARGVDVPGRTLRVWRQTKRDRLQEIQTQLAPQIEELIVSEARTSAMLAAEVEREALKQTLTQLKAGQAKDPSTSARNASTVKGINVDKMLTLSGRPSVIHETRQASDIIAELVKIAPNVFQVDSEVTEITSPATTEAP